jgi:hypothetical protein
MMAFSDKFRIDVKGIGGHGAHPQGTVDAIVEAAALVTALQTVVSRNMVSPSTLSPHSSSRLLTPPLVSSLLLSSPHSSSRLLTPPLVSSVSSSSPGPTPVWGADLRDHPGRLREQHHCRPRGHHRHRQSLHHRRPGDLPPPLLPPLSLPQDLIKSRMGDICCGVARTYGGSIDLDYECLFLSLALLPSHSLSPDGYPPVVNSFPECVAVVQTAAAKIVGAPRSGLSIVTMGAEDFSFFLQKRPGPPPSASLLPDASPILRLLLHGGLRSARRDQTPPQVRLRFRRGASPSLSLSHLLPPPERNVGRRLGVRSDRERPSPPGLGLGSGPMR